MLDHCASNVRLRRLVRGGLALAAFAGVVLWGVLQAASEEPIGPRLAARHPARTDGVGIAPASAHIRNVVVRRSGSSKAGHISAPVSGLDNGSLVAAAEAPFLSTGLRLASNDRSPWRPIASKSADTRENRHVRSRASGVMLPELHTSLLDEQSVNVFLPVEDFADTDPGSWTAKMSGLDVDALRSVASGCVQVVAANGERGRMVGEARLAWLYEYVQRQSGTSSTAFFAPGDKGIFAVQSLTGGYNWAVLGWGVRWELAAGWSAYTHYDTQASSQQMIHIGSAGLRYAW